MASLVGPEINAGRASLLRPELTDVAWDFVDRVPDDLDALHPYPAKFIPEIPAALLDAFPRPKGLVVDPFAGSGTTLTQCQRRGIQSAGIDLNPIACLIARVRTRSLPEAIDEHLSSTTERARNLSPVLPSIPRLDHWFDRDVQGELAALTDAINASPADARDLLRLSLSSIVVRVSKQESDTRYAAVQKTKPKGGTFGAFEVAAKRTIRVLRQRSYALTPSQVIEANTLTFDWRALGQPIAAVITSPPYPNAYEYWLYHKYRMYWLGADPLAVKKQEIGARAHFFGGNKHTADHFVDQMRRTIGPMAMALLPTGYAAFVVGRSKIHGQVVDNAAIIADVGREIGLRVEHRAERTIAATRKSFNLSHANIKTETVIILTR